MCGPADIADEPHPEGAPDLHRLLPATAAAVRETLRAVTAMLGPPASRDLTIAELVLAEVLNNVVEHACAGDAGHVIGLRIWCGASGIRVSVTDDGRPMPGLHLPGRDFTAPDALPEGGFGWPLIHRLAQSLDYRREAGRNVLTFAVCTNACPGGPELQPDTPDPAGARRV